MMIFRLAFFQEGQCPLLYLYSGNLNDIKQIYKESIKFILCVQGVHISMKKSKDSQAR